MRSNRIDWNHLVQQLSVTSGIRFDANETAFFTRSLEAVDKEIHQKLYPEFKWARLVPLFSGVHEGAQAFVSRHMDIAGLAKTVVDYATDFPASDVQLGEDTSPIVSGGSSYRYSIQDMRAAQLANVPLDTFRAMAARQMIERYVNSMVLLGDSTKGVTGFYKSSAITPDTSLTGTWSSATADAILKDLLILEQVAYKASKGVETPDTLVLPPSLNALLNKPVGDNLQWTVRKAFLEQSEYVKNIETDYLLESANASNNGPRKVCYRRDPSKLRAIVPVVFEQFPPQPKGMTFEVNCHCRVGGTEILYPGSVVYNDQ